MCMMMMTLMKLVNSATKFRHGIDKFYQPNSGLRGSKTWDEAIYIYTYIYTHIYVHILHVLHIWSIYIYTISCHTFTKTITYIYIYMRYNDMIYCLYIYICTYIYIYICMICSTSFRPRTSLPSWAWASSPSQMAWLPWPRSQDGQPWSLWCSPWIWMGSNKMVMICI